MANILAVDDENDVLALISNILQKDGHVVTAVSNAREVMTLQLEAFDMIILDVMMPGIDGFSLCGAIRDRVDCPILFLTAKVLEIDIMTGLGEGADDYILKPFGTGELRARINAHLRRENRERSNAFSLGGIHFNLSGKTIAVHDKQLPFTKSEYEICEFLACSHGQVFSKEKIFESVFGFDRESDVSAITEHIKNIRAKFAKVHVSPIETVWGIGYKWI